MYGILMLLRSTSWCSLAPDILYTWVNKHNLLLGAYWLLSTCFFPGFAPG